LNERIKKLRKVLNLTQREFGERIGVKANTIATYEIGRNNPIDAVISLICREFSVNETWLRNGEGEMFRPHTQNDLISDFMGDILNSEPDFRQQLISVLARMTPEEWRILERKAVELTDNLRSQGEQSIAPTTPQNQRAELIRKPNPPIPEGSTPEIEAQVARIREQLIIEASTGTSGASTQARAG